ncbi:hypothetical protein TNCV_5006811 [Trichonephila clavipes]|nr:hypothetical protein TNCV_5006811 [Trichonephila clavipes]
MFFQSGPQGHWGCVDTPDLGSHEARCTNQGVSRPVESKIPEVSTELREQPQLQHIRVTFSRHSLLIEEKRPIHLCL